VALRADRTRDWPQLGQRPQRLAGPSRSSPRNYWPALPPALLVISESQPSKPGPRRGHNNVRLQRAVSSLRAGYGKTVLLDGRTDQVQFGRTQAEEAQEFIARRHPEHVEVCPGRMASTAEEVAVAAPCVQSRHAHRILIVTSDYHTRRALAIFRHRLPQYEWSVTAAPDESAYGTDWWRRRAWAKTWWSEAQRLAWGELVDRWRYGPRVKPRSENGDGQSEAGEQRDSHRVAGHQPRIRQIGRLAPYRRREEVISRQERNQGVSFRSDWISSCVSWPGYTESHVDMVLFS